MTLTSLIGSPTPVACLLAFAFVSSGCGADGGAPEKADSAETNRSTTTQTVATKPTRLALAHLRAGTSRVGPVVITVELSRTAGVYTLKVVASRIEPYVVLFATGSCEQYYTGTQRRTGRKIYEERGMPVDSPQGGDPGVRHVVALDADRARALLSHRLTVFANAGGAHGGDFNFCGALRAVKP